MLKYTLSLIAMAGLVGCQSPAISSNVQKSSSRITTIAISPSSGMFGDAVGIELANRGITVIDSGQAASMLLTAGMEEFQIYRPDKAKPIVDKGVDAILSVRASVGYDNRPDSATVKLVNLKDGKIVVGANWQNGRGGARGSPADAGARVGIVDAAKMIADTVTEALK